MSRKSRLRAREKTRARIAAKNAHHPSRGGKANKGPKPKNPNFQHAREESQGSTQAEGVRAPEPERSFIDMLAGVEVETALYDDCSRTLLLVHYPRTPGLSKATGRRARTLGGEHTLRGRRITTVVLPRGLEGYQVLDVLNPSHQANLYGKGPKMQRVTRSGDLSSLAELYESAGLPFEYRRGRSRSSMATPSRPIQLDGSRVKYLFAGDNRILLVHDGPGAPNLELRVEGAHTSSICPPGVGTRITYIRGETLAFSVDRATRELTGQLGLSADQVKTGCSNYNLEGVGQYEDPHDLKTLYSQHHIPLSEMPRAQPRRSSRTLAVW